MSTTFGIKVGDDNSGYDIYEEYDGYTVSKIAFRSNDGEIYFINPFAKYLKNEIEVISLDNEPQGIFTVGDIQKKIDENIKRN